MIEGTIKSIETGPLPLGEDAMNEYAKIIFEEQSHMNALKTAATKGEEMKAELEIIRTQLLYSIRERKYA